LMSLFGILPVLLFEVFVFRKQCEKNEPSSA
jgi:hypothetical protein